MVYFYKLLLPIPEKYHTYSCMCNMIDLCPLLTIRQMKYWNYVWCFLIGNTCNSLLLQLLF